MSFPWPSRSIVLTRSAAPKYFGLGSEFSASAYLRAEPVKSLRQLGVVSFLMYRLLSMKIDMKKIAVITLFVSGWLSGCAGGVAGGFDSVNFGNAAQVHIFTPEEQNAMTAEGTIPTMLAPSEIRAHFEKIRDGKNTKPTGVVTYCDAGLAQLIQARRNQALAAIDGACGGKDQYEIRHEGLGNLKVRYAGNLQVGASCTRSKAVMFRCNGVQPKPNLSK